MGLTAYPTGQVDVTTYWIAYNNTSGARRTDIVFNTTTLTLAFTRAREALVSAVTGGGTAPVTLAADTTAHTDWGFRHIGGGLYRVDFPDAAFLTGAAFTVLDVYGPTDTVFVPAGGAVDLMAGNPRSATVDANMVAAASNTLTASALSADAVTEIRDAIFSRPFDATKMAGVTFEELTALLACAVLAKDSGMGANAPTFRNLGDTATAIAGTTDASGNRTAVTLTPAAVR